MAVIKFNNRKDSSTKRGVNKLKRAITYITNLHKTRDDLIGGIGVNKENAFKRMNIIKQYYNKPDGREYIHFVVSFKGKQDVYAVYDIACRISLIYDKYQVLFAVHNNTQNTHIHFVINTVCVTNGHKFSQSRSDMQNLKEKIETIINQSGLLCDEIYEELQSFDWENEDFEYEDEQELYEPMIFYEKPKLIEPMIFYKQSKLIDPMIFFSKGDSHN